MVTGSFGGASLTDSPFSKVIFVVTAVPGGVGGEITGGVKQIAVAVGQGSIAAMTAFEDIASPYWAKTERGAAVKAT